jgi:hypothetical protein
VVSSCYYGEEECSSSEMSSSCNKFEHADVLNNEDVCDNGCYDFSDFITNGFAVENFLEQPDNDHGQVEETCGNILLSIDKISLLLAHDFKKYANVSKAVCTLPCHSFPYDEVVSPKFDAEVEVRSGSSELNSKGMSGESLYTYAPNNFCDEESDVTIKSIVDSLSCSYSHEREIHSDLLSNKRVCCAEDFHADDLFNESVHVYQHSDDENVDYGSVVAATSYPQALITLSDT